MDLSLTQMSEKQHAFQKRSSYTAMIQKHPDLNLDALSSKLAAKLADFRKTPSPALELFERLEAEIKPIAAELDARG